MAIIELVEEGFVAKQKSDNTANTEASESAETATA